MRFLGDTPETALPGIEALLHRIGESLSGVEVRAGGAGCFPTCRRPRVVYAAVEDRSAALETWHQAVEKGLLEELGLAKDDRPFRPHITVAYARDRRPGDRERVQESVERLSEALPEAPERLNRIVLFQSDLGPQGALHRPVYTVELPAG